MSKSFEEHKLIFEEHKLMLVEKLKLTEVPEVKIGEEAKDFILKNGDGKRLRGGYDYKTNTVVVINPKRIGTLAHEMRHAWQCEHRVTENFEFPNSPKNSYYYGHPKEIDADKFARDYCKENGLRWTAFKYCFRVKFHQVIKFLFRRKGQKRSNENGGGYEMLTKEQLLEKGWVSIGCDGEVEYFAREDENGTIQFVPVSNGKTLGIIQSHNKTIIHLLNKFISKKDGTDKKESQGIM